MKRPLSINGTRGLSLLDHGINRVILFAIAVVATALPGCAPVELAAHAIKSLQRSSTSSSEPGHPVMQPRVEVEPPPVAAAPRPTVMAESLPPPLASR